MIDSVFNQGEHAANLKRARRTRTPATPTLDRLPPHSLEAETGVLGCILLSPNDCLNECEERGVEWNWFYDLRHQLIFHTMLQMHKQGETVDVITLQERLKVGVGIPSEDGRTRPSEGNTLDQIGGISFLAQLPDAVPSAANLSYYVDYIKEYFLRRRLVGSCSAIVGRIYDSNVEVRELLDQHEREILKLSEDLTGAGEHRIKEILRRVAAKLENYQRGQAQITGITTGLDYLDKLLCGLGGENGNYDVISARPGTGKTALATQIALHVALDYAWWDPVLDEKRLPIIETDAEGRERIKAIKKIGMPVGIFSLEMQEDALVQRMLFQRAGADLQRWRTGFSVNDDVPRLVLANHQIAKPDNIFVDDKGRRTIDSLRATARRMFRQHGIKLFIIDYIQLLRAGGRRGREDRVQELSDISGEIQALGKELNIPIIVIAQMNRDYEKEPNRRPRLSDLKDCGAIEQDADLVGFLFQPKLKDKAEEVYDAAMRQEFGDDWSRYPKRVDLLIAKNRYGPSDKIAQLLFEGHCTRFLDYNAWLKEKGYKEPAAGEAGRGRARSKIDDEDVP